MQILWQPHTLASVTLHSSLSSSPPLIKWPCSADNLISLRGPDTWFNCVHITDLFSPSGPRWGHMAADGTHCRYIKCFAGNFRRYDSCLPPSIHPSRCPFSSGRNSRQPGRLRLPLLHKWHHRGRLLFCSLRQITSQPEISRLESLHVRPRQAPVWSVFGPRWQCATIRRSGGGIFFKLLLKVSRDAAERLDGSRHCYCAGVCATKSSDCEMCTVQREEIEIFKKYI